MATIKLTISSKVNKTIGKAELGLRFFHGAIDLRAKTGIYVSSQRWNDSKESIIIPRGGTPEVTELTNLQSKIDELSSLISNSFVSTDRKLIDKQWLETLIDKFNYPEKYIVQAPEEIEPQMLLAYIEDFITRAPERRNVETGRLLTKNNIQQYKAMQKHITAFAEIMHKPDFKFSEINRQFYDDFVVYLQNPIQDTKDGVPLFNKDKTPKLSKLPFTQNTVGKHIRILKLMLNDAPKNLVADSEYSNFKVFNEDVDSIYLNEAELLQLKNADLSKIQYLDRVRDWFLLLAWTGCRFSDLEKISKTDIKDNFITFRQQKTTNKVTIPLHPVVLEILEKYKYSMPKAISNQRFNEYIKEAALKAELTQPETFTRTVGGKLITTKLPKCDLISSHTGRRSFATNMYKLGIQTITIMSITGHKSEKTFLKYIKVKQEEHAAIMAEAWKKMY